MSEESAESAADAALGAGGSRPPDFDIVDQRDPQQVLQSDLVFDGRIWSVRRDTVRLPGGEEVVREVVDHPGAVGIIALDDQDRVALIRQYRHAVKSYLWEAPAGLIDVDGEPPLLTAQRELFEETHLRADTWHLLVDYYNSPGGSTEAFRCFLARDVSEVEGERHPAEDEEVDMPLRWVPLDDAVAKALAGELHNPTSVACVLAAYASRALGWTTLRPPDSPWPERFPDGLPSAADID